MNMITGNTYLADVQIRSPMGWVKVEATLTLTSETDFSGSAKLLGFTVALTDCSRSGSHFRFAAACRSCPSACCRCPLKSTSTGAAP